MDNAFKNVVLPEPVPPLIKMLYPPSTSFLRKSAASFVIEPHLIKSSIVIWSAGNFLIVTAAPSIATGGKTTFTLEPSGNLVSTIGSD